MRPLVKKALIRVALFVMCGCLGGPLFWLIEHQPDYKAEKKALLQSLNKTMSIKYNMTAQEFDNFTKMAYEARAPAKPAWNIENGLEFAFTTITTIGYGRVTPVTPLGQILCIFYGLIGIPITLLALKSVGELIEEGLSKLIRKFETRLLRKEEVYHCEVKCFVTSFSITVVMVCLGAVLAMITENWTFLEGSYFWFVSFSTIGYGDYIMTETEELAHDAASGDVERAWIEIAVQVFYTVWFILGMCMVSSLIASIQAIFEKIRCPQSCPGCFTPHGRRHKVKHEISEEPSKRNAALEVSTL